MSTQIQEKKKLLKLSKTELIKMCKKYKLLSNGSKSDMIDRILKYQNRLKPDIPDKPQKKKRRKPLIKNKAKSGNNGIILSRNAFHIVLTGYIRIIQNVLSNTIIPIEINILCFNYLLPKNIFITLKRIRIERGFMEYVNYLDIEMWKLDEIQNEWENRKANIIQLDETQKRNKYIFQKDFGFIKGLNVKLPTKINQTMQAKKPNYDIIFKSGGRAYDSLSLHCSNECVGFIINDDHKNNAKIYNWQLPDLPLKLCDHTMVYSHKYGLLCIGGKIGGDNLSPSWNIYKLPFNTNIYKKQDFKTSYLRLQWKWKKLKKMMCQMVNTHAIIVESKLFCCGGKRSFHGIDIDHRWYRTRFYNYDHNTKHVSTVIMLDLEEGKNNKWKKLCDMNYGRWNAGICYNKYRNWIIIGGGDGASSQRIEKFDIGKNKWLNVANTKYAYYYKPILWIDDMDPNIIFITSSNRDSDRLQRIDLRMDHVYSTKCRQSYKQISDICIRLY